MLRPFKDYVSAFVRIYVCTPLFWQNVHKILYWGPLCSVIDPVLRLGKGRRVTRPNSILLDDVIKNDFLLLLSSSMAFSAWLLKK